jgi:aryl-alcohol dehydrogenase-like predicted oxidoreductase
MSGQTVAVARRQIGKTGVEVQAMGLGAMPLSLDGRPQEQDAMAVIHAFLDLGGGLIDTANVYCIDNADIGHNERLIAKALRAYAGGGNGAKAVRVATKGGLTRPAGRWETDGRPEFLRASCEASLKALGSERIFLYQLHAVDPRIPLRDSVAALARLREEGKIEHLGLSNVSLAQLQEAQGIVEIVSVQNRFNLFERRDQLSGLIDHCTAQGITYLAYAPVGGHFSHSAAMAHAGLQERAARYGVTGYTLALTWLLGLGPAILPIPGASRLASVRDCRRALDVALSDADRAFLDSL